VTASEKATVHIVSHYTYWCLLLQVFLIVYPKEETVPTRIWHRISVAHL